MAPVGQGKKYAWLQTPKGRAYIKRHNDRSGAKKTAKWRANQPRDEFLAKHAEQQRSWNATLHGKRTKKNAALLKAYGITVDQFEAMASAQQGMCAICGSVLDMGFNTHVDHCHDSGDVRGLLCRDCNVGLGAFGDDTTSLERAISYLKKGERQWP